MSILVTGANTGIGNAIVQHLLKRTTRPVLLAARNDTKANDAVKEITDKQPEYKDRLKPIAIELTDNDSIKSAAKKLKDNGEKLSVLCNNAGYAQKGSLFNADVAQKSQDINYYGTKAVINAFRPLLQDNARVINVSSTSSAHALNKMKPELRDNFLAADLTEEQLDSLLKSFVQSVGRDEHEKDGWPTSAYGVSKVGTSMLTRIRARDDAQNGVKYFAMCPGYVKTNMTGHSSAAKRMPEEGAETAAHLATMSDTDAEKYNGRFFYDSKPVEYTTNNMG